MIKIITNEELKNIRENRDKAIANIEKATELRRDNMKQNKLVNSMDEFWIDIALDFSTNGFIEPFPHGRVVTYGSIMSHPLYYRGEIQDYGNQCCSSLGRKLKQLSLEDAIIEKFIAQLRIVSFCNIISQLKQVKEWNIGNVFGYMIAQHYGLETQYIDITDDIEVALFFACCKHIGNNKYKPIKDSDINDIGKYGVLYRGTNKIYNMTNKEYMKEGLKDILPIGYQPFTRCYKQRGYFIDTEQINDITKYDLEIDSGFKKYYIHRTCKLSNEIYEKFNGGKSLFPYDALVEIERIIEQISCATNFSTEEFEKVFLSLNNKRAKDWWIMKLESKGIVISGCGYKLSKSIVSDIDKKWNINAFIDNERIAVGEREIVLGKQK